ncbi:adenosylcobinamide-GDP ribazoletransferase [Streptomyces sp. NPDC048639]|uniref:adenosylcobinamide-GDP ribazoletransferase n=1 Tax=Streptomyces sp. NPDC048639 TaxID=3365581 RepID=UPI003719DE19
MSDDTTSGPAASGPAEARDGTAPGSPATPGEGLRFAFGTLTVFRVRVTRWDHAAGRSGMLCAPVAGAAVGLCAAAAAGLLYALGGGPLLAAVAAVAVPAVLTRGLHLDGLADTADGLGSGRPADDALRIMKRSDIGPFGVVTLVLVLLAQVAALYELFGAGAGQGALGALTAAVAARLALTLASRTGVPAARPDGLGAAVAATVPVGSAAVAAAVTVAACAAAGASLGPYGAVRHALAVLIALGAAELLLRHCRRRLGGVTGDVFGALAETAATAALLALAVA